MPKTPSPLEIATWRFERIAPLLGESLSSAQRRRLRSKICRPVTVWPSGKRKRVPRTTLHRWIVLFKRVGFSGLIPKRRLDRGTQRRDTREIIEYAIGLLLERADRSTYLLSRFLAQKFQGYDLPRATLARHIRAHATYPTIEKLRGKLVKLRGRYEASFAHECWQLDGKGPFRVRLITGRVVRVHLLIVLDDYSRAIVAAIVATAEDECSAIRVFQRAVRRYGLPSRMQFDRGSAFDSHGLRHGLAQLGVHRNAVKARNPRAQGKIEAVNKSFDHSFIAELEFQVVRDLEHLQELLDAYVEMVYQLHLHRALKTTPHARLAGKVSARQVSENDLMRAFLVEHVAKTDRTTGEVALPNGRFVVPIAYAGKRSRFRFDRLRSFALLVTTDDREIEIAPFAIRPLPKPVLPDRSRTEGQLQRLLDEYQGRERENAEPAFGFPEVLKALGSLVERNVPSAEVEANLVLAFWNRVGPIASRPFLTACESSARTLGKKRALRTYLDHLTRRIESDRSKKPHKESP